MLFLLAARPLRIPLLVVGAVVVGTAGLVVDSVEDSGTDEHDEGESVGDIDDCWDTIIVFFLAALRISLYVRVGG